MLILTEQYKKHLEERYAKDVEVPFIEKPRKKEEVAQFSVEVEKVAPIKKIKTKVKELKAEAQEHEKFTSLTNYAR